MDQALENWIQYLQVTAPHWRFAFPTGLGWGSARGAPTLACGVACWRLDGQQCQSTEHSSPLCKDCRGSSPIGHRNSPTPLQRHPNAHAPVARMQRMPRRLQRKRNGKLPGARPAGSSSRPCTNTKNGRLRPRGTGRRPTSWRQKRRLLPRRPPVGLQSKRWVCAWRFGGRSPATRLRGGRRRQRGGHPDTSTTRRKSQDLVLHSWARCLNWMGRGSWWCREEFRQCGWAVLASKPPHAGPMLQRAAGPGQGSRHKGPAPGADGADAAKARRGARGTCRRGTDGRGCRRGSGKGQGRPATGEGGKAAAHCRGPAKVLG